MSVPFRQIRAVFNDETIRVYQAYSNAIADSALRAGRLVSPPFEMDRMTWIKPSFLWMMYRSDWATKPGQERILAIDISRQGFEWALAHSCLSHFEAEMHRSREEWQRLKNASPVRIQWDPERDIHLNRLEYRSLQVGLAGDAVKWYVDQWICRISDRTAIAKRIAETHDPSSPLLPVERPYPLRPALAHRIRAFV